MHKKADFLTMTFAELESHENTYCTLHYFDGNERTGTLRRAFDAASRPYFTCNAFDVVPGDVAFVSPAAERPRMTLDQPVIPGDVETPHNAVRLSAEPHVVAIDAGTAVFAADASGLGWIGFAATRSIGGDIAVVATATDGAPLARDPISVRASDVSVLRELGNGIAVGERVLRQNSEGRVQLMHLVTAPVRHRDHGGEAEAADMWLVQVYGRGDPPVAVRTHCGPDEMAVPSAVAEAIERAYRSSH